MSTVATSVSLLVPEKAEDLGVKDQEVEAGNVDEGEGLIVKVFEADVVEVEDDDEGGNGEGGSPL